MWYTSLFRTTELRLIVRSEETLSTDLLGVRGDILRGSSRDRSVGVDLRGSHRWRRTVSPL